MSHLWDMYANAEQGVIEQNPLGPDWPAIIHLVPRADPYLICRKCGTVLSASTVLSAMPCSPPADESWRLVAACKGYML